MGKRLLAIKCVVYTLWPMSAWATAITLDRTVAAVPWLAWLMVLLLSTVSGLAALLSRLRQEMPARMWVFVAAHMLGSVLAGLLTFFAAEGADVNDFAEAVVIGLAAYAGAKLMDRWSDKFVERTAS